MADLSKPLGSVQSALDLDSDADSIKAYYAKWAES